MLRGEAVRGMLRREGVGCEALWGRGCLGVGGV